MKLRRVVAVAALIAAAAALVPASPAAAVECDGVIVVVDPGPLRGDPTVRCAPGEPSSGYEALRGAGHTVEDVPGQPGLVCTIDGRPDPCRISSSAYWSYWHADQGGSWTYSNVGAGNRAPPPGTVEGWRFGDGSSAPSLAPPSGEEESEPEPEESEPEPEEPSSGGSTTEPGSDDPSPSGSTSSDSAEEPITERSTEDGDSPAATDDDRDRTIDPAEPAPDVPVDGTAGYRSPAPSDEQDPSDERDDPVTDDRAAADEVALPDRDDGSAPVGLVVGGGLVTGLAALTALQVRRRRLEG